jgi:hypothetical protein
MDLFNLGNLTACCTCSRKADVKANGDDGNGFAQRRQAQVVTVKRFPCRQ